LKTSFAAHLSYKEETKVMKIQQFLHTFFDTLRLAAHLDIFDGTLVRRGTPVEKFF
jgi:hypothetical protein